VVKIFKREYLVRILLVISGLLFTVVICEFGLRAFYAFSDKAGKYYVYPPDLRKIQKIAAGIMPGVADTARFFTNSEGIRGDEFSPADQYRILAIGGSTTACLYLDQEKAWPSALQNKLNGLQKSKVWVGNIGKAGLSSREHFMHMKYLLDQYPKIDAIIILVGCNDLFRRLIEDSRYDPFFLDHYEYWRRKLTDGAFSQTPYYPGKYRFKTGYYDQSALGNLYVRVRTTYSHKEMVQDEQGNYVVGLRNLRKNASEFIDLLPDLQSALAEYETNLKAIIDMAQSRSIRLVFVTQPTLLRPGMPQEEKDLITVGWIDNQKSGRYYSPEALAEGLKRYNDTLKNVCRDRNIECIDLASALPKNTRMFYDEVHLNDKGSIMTADVIFNFLKQEKPFQK